MWHVSLSSLTSRTICFLPLEKSTMISGAFWILEATDITLCVPVSSFLSDPKG